MAHRFDNIGGNGKKKTGAGKKARVLGMLAEWKRCGTDKKKFDWLLRQVMVLAQRTPDNG